MTLLHPVFGQFKDDCETLTPTWENNSLALTLQEILSNFYDGKDERSEAIWDALRDAGIILTRTVIEGTQSATDGDAHSAEGAHRFNIAIIRNELGSGGADPYLHASSCYLESTRNHASRMPYSVLPCIILLVFGSSRNMHFVLIHPNFQYRSSYVLCRCGVEW